MHTDHHVWSVMKETVAFFKNEMPDAPFYLRTKGPRKVAKLDPEESRKRDYYYTQVVKKQSNFSGK